MTSPEPSFPAQRFAASALILLGVAVLAVAASLGGIWPARAGVALALVAGTIALIVAYSHARQARHRHGAQLVQVSREQRTYVRDLRIHHRGIVESLSTINACADESVRGLTHEVTQLSAKLSIERGVRLAIAARLAGSDQAAKQLRVELAESQLGIDARDALLAELGQERSTPHRLPASGAEGEARWAVVRDELSAEDDLWGDDQHPTVVELKRRTGCEFDGRRLA